MNIDKKIQELKSKLTGDMMKDLETRDQIHKLEMKKKNIKPKDSHFECFGCGS